MPQVKQAAKTSRSAKRAGTAKAPAARKTSSKSDPVVFLNIGVSRQARAGLNKLVVVLNVPNQRGVLEQLIAAELHRHHLRLPRA